MLDNSFLWSFNRCFNSWCTEATLLCQLTSLFLITFNTSDFNRGTSLILWNRSKQSKHRFTLQQSQQRIPPRVFCLGSFDAHRCSWHEGSFALGRVGQWKYFVLRRTRRSPLVESSALSFTTEALVDCELSVLRKVWLSSISLLLLFMFSLRSRGYFSGFKRWSATIFWKL